MRTTLKRLSPLILILFLVQSSVFAAPIPLVVLDAPDSSPIGQPLSFTVTFDNNGDTGYAPFIDLWIPTRGADGGDGMSFVSAQYLGEPVDVGATRVFLDDGCISHPYLRDTDSVPIPVCGTPGDTLVVLDLPFGSFTPDQPAAEIDVIVDISPNADPGFPLNVQARGGFRFGATPVDDPCCDENIAGEIVSTPITPTFLTVTKTNNIPENEIATGPNFEYEWTIEVDVSNGQTVTDVVIMDTLPNGIVFTGVIDTMPPLSSPVGQAGNVLTFNFPDVTGDPGAADVSVTFGFTIARTDDDGNPIIDPNIGAEDLFAYNNATASGFWTPPDPNDGAGPVDVEGSVECPSTTCPGGAAPEVMALAVQKAVVPDGGAVIAPGTRLRYTLDFQISDFFAFQDVTLTDIISDGQRLDLSPGFTPVFTYNQHGAANTFDPVTFSLEEFFTGGVPGPGGVDGSAVPGDTRIIFDLDADVGGLMLGGCIPLAGTPVPDCTAFNGGGTLGQVIYYTIVQDAFTDDFPSGDASVDQGDTLDNLAVLDGQIVNPEDFSPVGFASDDDDTQAQITIPRGEPGKAIYAVNGTPCGACTDVSVAPGDTITYLVQHETPSSDFEDLTLVDYLPLPVFTVAEFTTPMIRDQINTNIPAPGTAKIFAGDTLYNRMSAVLGAAPDLPTLSTDATNNTLTFAYDDFDDPQNQATTIAIAFTVTVQSAPYADGLSLTNLVRVEEGSTNSGDGADDAIIQIEVTRPLLALRKGAVATTSPAGEFVPTIPGPVTFNPPGSPTPFDGVVSSNGLDQTPIDSDLTGVTIGDLVTFAIVIDNRGQSENGAFDIKVRDTIAPGFAIPPSGPNLNISLGNGDDVDYISLPGGTNTDNDLFGAGIELVDPGVGVCGPYDGDSGTNIVIITYDLLLQEITGDVLTNTAIVTEYSSEEGGGDLTGDQDLTETTDVFFSGGGSGEEGESGLIAKTVDKPFAKAGERVTWTVNVRNPGPNALTDVSVTDTLPDGVIPIRATSTQGTLTLTGQTYTAAIGTMEAGETIQITLVSDIRQALDPPFILVNRAILFSGDLELGQDEATVTVVERLADTGASPWSRLRRALPFIAGLLLAAGAILFQSRYRVLHRYHD